MKHCIKLHIMEDIFTQSWQKVGVLPESVNSPHTVTYDDDVWIMSTKSVYVIGGVTNEIRFVGNTSYGVHQPAVLLFNHRIYLFGGRNSAYDAHNSWQFYNLLDATDYPSNYPSDVPSKFPSDVPSKYPSDVPSKFPSVFPSKFPSVFPSKFPSVVPSKHPSDYPSATPITSGSPANTTNIPTLNAIYLSIGPTLSVVSTLGLSSTFDATDDAISSNNKEDTLPNVWTWAAIIVSSVTVMVMLIGFIVYIIRKWKEKMVQQITRQVREKVIIEFDIGITEPQSGIMEHDEDDNDHGQEDKREDRTTTGKVLNVELMMQGSGRLPRGKSSLRIKRKTMTTLKEWHMQWKEI
eukprot:159680_1